MSCPPTRGTQCRRFGGSLSCLGVQTVNGDESQLGFAETARQRVSVKAEPEQQQQQQPKSQRLLPLLAPRKSAPSPSDQTPLAWMPPF